MAHDALASPLGPSPVLAEGRTCWRILPATRVAFLVDGEAYFGAVSAALERARRRVWLLGWDFASGMRLRREPGAPDLVGLLDGLARRRPRLDVYVLDWDFAMLFALERQLLPALRFGRRTHRRVHFALDGNHPLGASHHQKLVVVDDTVAFAGGFDLASCRWDSREHANDDPRRCDAGFGSYPPFHDVGIVFEGPAARAVAELAQERWRSATGRRVRPLPARRAPSPWPDPVPSHLERVELGLARTQPKWNGSVERREVEALWLAAIESARRWIYIENQYFTAGAIGDALAARLAEPEGPEIVILVPQGASGWLEERTMGVLRARLVRRLRQADRHGRLAIVHPVVPGGARLNVHSKVLIVDDQLVRVGSSNLSNRSMGLDTELDVAIEARGQPRVERAIAAFREDLLAEHLGTPADQVRATAQRQGSLIATLEAHGRGERGVRPLEVDLPQALDDWIPESAVLDPERAVSFEELCARILPALPREPERRRRLLLLAGVALLLVGLAAVWRLSPLADSLRPDAVAAFAAPLRAAPWGPATALLAVAVAGALFVPITALIVASALLYGPWLGFTVALGGACGAAVLGWGIGRLLWRDAVHRLMSPRLRRLSLRVARRGVFATAAAHVVPVAPFAAISLAAGASHVRLRDFALGTALGLAPGILAACVLADRLARVIIDPGWVGAAVLLGLTALVVLAGRWVHGRLERA